MAGFWGPPAIIQAVPTNPIDTDVSTVATVQQMCVLARHASHGTHVISVLNKDIIKSPRVSKRDVCRRIFWWIKQHIHFVEDETLLAYVLGYRDVHQELLIAPDRMLEMPHPMGDCDDFAMLTAAMALACGMAAKFTAIAVDEVEPFRFSHVYCSAYLSDEGEWIAMDTSHGKQLGWEYRGVIFRKAEWLV